MSKANVGHSALDVTAGIVDELKNQPADARIAFLQAAVTHAEGQAEQAEHQYEAIAEKRLTVQAAWSSKLDEADKIRQRAHATVDAYNHELNALVD